MSHLWARTNNLYEFPYTSNLGLSGSGNNRTVIEKVYDGSSVIKLQPNTTYYMSGDRSTSQDVNGVIALFTSYPTVGSISKHFYYYNSTSQPGVEFTTESDEVYGLIEHRSSSDYTTDYHMMLNVGTTALPYEPYRIEKPLDHIRLNNVRSENLASSYNATGYLTQYNAALFANFDIKPNTEYTLSFDALQGATLYTNEHIFTSSAAFVTDGSRYHVTLVTKSSIPGDQYISGLGWLLLKNALTLQSNPQISNVMLNLGSIALPYQPYLITKEAWEAKSRVILHGLTNPLCGIDTHKDTLDLSTGLSTMYVKELVLTGDENWTYEPTYSRFLTSVVDFTSFGLRLTPFVSNTFGCVSDGRPIANVPDNTIYSASLNVDTIHSFYIKCTTYTSLDDFKSYLASEYSAGHPVTIWYVLATPETEQITVPSNLTGIVEGFLTQTGTPTPTNPIYPTANGTPEQGGTYSLDTGAYAIAWGRADTFTGTSSISARCYGLPVKSWEIDGNTQQSGTPAPDNIIMPEFVGERTENLFDESYPDISTSVQRITINVPNGDYTMSTTDFPVVAGASVFLLLPGETAVTQTNGVFGGHPVTQTVTDGKIIIGYRINGNRNPADYHFMLNTGTNALPYKPYGYAIQTSSSTQNTVSGQTPLTLTDSIGHNLISWDGEGATTSSGTPAPTSPVTVSGWGDKTANLFDGTVSATNQRMSTSGTGTYAAQGYSVSKYIEIEPSTTYSLSTGELCFYNIYDENKHYIYGAATYDTIPGTYDNARYTRFDFKTANIPSVIIVKGSTAPSSYIPYGYKLSITSAGQTVPVYLGQVPTTRRVKKLVLTGTENYGTSSGNTWLILGTLAKDFRGTADGAICSHLPLVLRSDFTTNTCAWGGGQIGDFLINIDNKNMADLKSYIAQQYAAGTPVTIWYVLAEPTTGIDNEPLMKIGDYADSITSIQSGVTIPTEKGNATLTTSNTVQPSTMHATYDKYISGGDIPVYLGQVPTTRRVRKLVLTGDETWTAFNNLNLLTLNPTSADFRGTTTGAICTHLPLVDRANYGTNTFCWSSGSTSELIVNIGDKSLSDLKTYLQQQYSAGTPVTIWYVLETPETAIVNEPLAKIDTYADTLTSNQAGIMIPTADGSTTISVDTALAPSRFEIKVHAKPI